jgi:hypothetical protein
MSYQTSYDKMDATRQKLDEVKLTMHKNIEVVIERGQKLEDLEEKAIDLELGATKFKDGSEALKKKMRWQYWRNVALIVLVVLALLGILIGIIYVSTKK